MRFINTTPESVYVHVRNKEGFLFRRHFAPLGDIVSLEFSEARSFVETVIPFQQNNEEVTTKLHRYLGLEEPLFEYVKGLPEPVEGTLYIVSESVFNQVVGRPDVVCIKTRNILDERTNEIKAINYFVGRR